MPTSAQKQLRELQKTLYERAFSEAQSYSVMGSPTILNYSDKFNASLPESFQKTNLVSILAKINKRKFLLYGDFHTLKQSQRGLIRLLKAYSSLYRERPIILALEMFKAKDQPHIDAYFDGKLSDQELLEVCEYARDWGFPWKNYKMILDFAIERRIKVIGINTESAGRDDLKKRDCFAADVLTDVAQAFPNHLVVCLIGEYHLADQHLPTELLAAADRKALGARSMRILTNVDRYYFKNPINNSSASSEYLYLKDDLYCILNSPPWIKWQSYTIWEEMRHVDVLFEPDGDGLDDFGGIYTEETFDVDYQVLLLLQNLTSFLRLPIKRGDLAGFTVYPAPDEETFAFLQEEYKLSSRIRDVAIERTSLDGYFFLAEANAFIIADISLNSLAQACGQFLYSLLHRGGRQPESSDELFYRRALAAAAGTIAAKILNPRRKGNDIWYFRRFLEQNQRKRLIGHALMMRETAKAVVKFHEWAGKRASRKEPSFQRPPRSIFKQDEFHYQEVSRALGNILGYTLYTRVMGHSASTETMRRLFMSPGKNQISVIDEFYSLYSSIMR